MIEIEPCLHEHLETLSAVEIASSMKADAERTG